MLRCTILASGSKGNCTVIRTERTRILVDAGLSCREIVKRMRFAGEDPEKIDGIIITHEHQDHIQGVSVLARRLKVPVYFTPTTHQAWMRWLTPRKTMSFSSWLDARKQQAAELSLAAAAVEEISAVGSVQGLTASPAFCESGELESPESAGSAVAVEDGPQPTLLPEAVGADPSALPAGEPFHAGVPVVIGDSTITPFPLPQEAADPGGFVLEAEGMRIAVATDLGYMPPNVRMHLQRADLLILESNHDVEMLRDGPYPWAIKQRVLSRVGHLSNDAAGEFLANEYDGYARWVVLAHISESNNLPELARLSAARALQARMNLHSSQVLLALQHSPLPSIVL